MPNNMGKRIYLGLAALLLPALVACSGQPAGPVDIDWQEGEMVAVGFLGYYDSFSAFENAPSYLQLTQKYPQIVEAAKVDCGVGRQIYLVVPRDPMASLAINEDGEYVTDENREVYYRSEEGKPVLLLNNWYEANSLISIVDNEGHAALYTPAIDTSGSLVVPGDGSVHDISLPMPEPMKGFTSFDYGEIFDGGDLGISVRLEAGQPILTSSTEPLTQLGYPEESIVLADGDKTFGGINGLCKGVFLGDIGQDYNPVVCVVMDNGDVKMSSVLFASQYGGPDLSDALPGIKDATGFESGPAGEWVDPESGETFYEYQSVFALDARGGRTEIPYFANYGVYRSPREDGEFEVILTPDWQFAFRSFSPDRAEMCNGYFQELESSEDGVFKFAFRQTTYSRFEDGNDVTDETVRTGTFTAREKGLCYVVDLSGSDVFPSGTEFRDARIMDSEADAGYEDF